MGGGAATRREVLGAAASGIVALGNVAPAMADWQGEPVRLTQVNGPQILKLKDAVESGDLEAVTKKLVKFDIYAKGVYKNQPFKQAQAVAIEDKNTAGVKSAYAEFLKVTNLPELFKGPKGS